MGDAAASSDPIWGLGLSLTMRDARVLSDALRTNRDWDAACREYAGTHDEYFAILHAAHNCMRELLVDSGPQADARRAHALPAIASGAVQMPDQGFCGPDLPFSEAERRHLFGED